MLCASSHEATTYFGRRSSTTDLLPALKVLYGWVQIATFKLGDHFWTCSRGNIFLPFIPFDAPQSVLSNCNSGKLFSCNSEYEKWSPDCLYAFCSYCEGFPFLEISWDTSSAGCKYYWFLRTIVSCPSFEKVITQKDLNHGEIPSPTAANNTTTTGLTSPDEAVISSW